MMQATLAQMIRLDLLLETIAGIMAWAISHHANKAFRLTGQKKLSDLSTGFLVLSAAMFGRVIGTLYFAALGESTNLLGILAIAYGSMKIMAYLLFLISTRPAYGVKETGNQQIAILLALPILIDPNLDLVAILVLIVVVLQSSINYMNTRSRYALYVLLGFLLLLLSHISSALAQMEFRGYLVSQILQFLGLASILVMLIRTGKEE